MKKNVFSLLGIIALVAVVGLGMAGCENGTTDDNGTSGGGGSSTGDTVKITNVAPQNGLEDGVRYDFTVTVEYNLMSQN
jgi:hypothetical protein